MKNSLLMYGVFIVLISLTSFSSPSDIGGQSALRPTYSIGGQSALRPSNDIGGQSALRPTFSIGGQSALRPSK